MGSLKRRLRHPPACNVIDCSHPQADAEHTHHLIIYQMHHLIYNFSLLFLFLFFLVRDQTEIAREALTKVVEAAGEVTRPYGDQEVHPAAAKFAYGDPNVMRVPCTLCMSSKAVIVAQPVRTTL